MAQDEFVIFIKDNKDGTIDFENEKEELLITLTCSLTEAQSIVEGMLKAMYRDKHGLDDDDDDDDDEE